MASDFPRLVVFTRGVSPLEATAVTPLIHITISGFPCRIVGPSDVRYRGVPCLDFLYVVPECQE